ncbi:RIP metalloprotease RseP [Sphingosinicella sp. LHD-64]|uniref:RIP metalloprotease RseP n=1 Tax=Sphingosinicella sp. LHD-64 TaxID=3072139 RepID=UPI00280F649F|nr:RIP metalloprotease RseP [Sphingosinicella sp. LHD-64]MDQ8754832.1 RIP metalloprotease RseP [Sphingosinicella sp. LHD-64]
MSSPGLFFTILAFLLVIGPLIFIHELGHYFAGRWFGVKAEAFSIGFGHEVFGWTDKRGTRWKVGWMPLGGYVRFKGDMNPASTPSDEWLALPAEERAETFQAKKLWQRFIIVAAGPITNFLFAILVYIALFGTYGQPRTPPVIATVLEGSAAASAGLRPGDRITAIDRRNIDRFEDIASYVSIRPDQRMTVGIERAGAPQTLEITPQSLEVEDRFGNRARIGRIGIGPGGIEVARLPAHQVVGAALGQTVDTVKMMVVTLGQVIRGQRSLQEMGGPLKIAQFSGQQASLGWLDFVLFMSLISINLGFINLLPIPLLDGGHLLFYAIEGVRRKPLKPEAQEWAFRTGLAVLLALMVFVTFNDLASFGLFTKLGGLIG